jgi:hypothetical protein
MPSTSKKQRNFMAAAAHNPAFAKKVGISQKVAKEFNAADKGKKFGTGGDVNYTYGGKGQINKQRTRGGSTFGYEKNVPNVNLNKYEGLKGGGMAKDMESKAEMRKEMAEDKKQDVSLITKAFKQHDKQEHKGSKGTTLKLSGGGSFRASANGIAQRGKTKGKMITMCGGGSAMAKKAK